MRSGVRAALTGAVLATLCLPMPVQASRSDGDWPARLDQATRRVSEAVAAVDTGSNDLRPPVTVSVLFARAASSERRLGRRLVRVAERNEELRALTASARLDGYEPHRFSVVTTTVSRWLAAQRGAADAALCRSVLPPGAGRWAPQRLTDYQPYLDCLDGEAVPRLTRLSGAAEKLGRALGEALGTGPTARR
jgi:hypothetical protein